EEKARQEGSKLEAERHRLIQERRPLLELQEKRRLLAEKLELARTCRPLVVKNAAEFRQTINRYFDALHPGYTPDLSQLITNLPHLANAERTLEQMDRCITEKETELAALDAELAALANKHRSGVLNWLKGR